MAFLDDIGDWMFGGARSNAQRVEERHEMNMKKMQSLLDSEEGRRLLQKSQILMNRSRAESLDRGEGYYGGRGEDPYVKGAEDLGKIRAARDKFLEDELPPETASYFDAAEKSVLDRMKTVSDTRPGGRDFVGPPAPVRKPAGKPEMETSKSAAEYLLPHDLRFEGTLPMDPDKGMFDRLSDYFQAPTETVPESNIPRTYPQLGITNVDDQAVLEEMQNALPEVDMKSEYEADPETMKKLIELWKAKKITKKNLHKAFSMIQQTAQQALGIA